MSRRRTAVQLCALWMSLAVGCQVDGSLGEHRPLLLGEADERSGPDASLIDGLWSTEQSAASIDGAAGAHGEDPAATDGAPEGTTDDTSGAMSAPDTAPVDAEHADAGGEEPVADPPAEPLPQPEPEPLSEPLPEPNAACAEPTEDLCLGCQREHCCEVWIACGQDEVCRCKMECRGLADQEACVQECGVGGDQHEHWLLCLEDACVDAC